MQPWTLRQAAQTHTKPIDTPKLTTGHFIALQREELQFTQQKTGTSSPNQETLTSRWSNPTHREQTLQLRGTMASQPAERAPQTQQSKQSEKAVKYPAGEQTWWKPTKPNKSRGDRESTWKIIQNNDSKWSEVSQLYLTLCDPMDCGLLGSSVHGILQARILEWFAISFSRGSSQHRDQTLVSHTAGRLYSRWSKILKTE